ncbi:hypothetical protein I4U23_000754 [Adineta vaga]|nr:hypothetical protein I4U23_000754 [Adineta vaga]
MFKKFRNQSENKHMKMNDSALRDIIPSDDVSFIEESRQPRLLKICKIVLAILILGVVAIGIVLLALILTYSGKSFLNFILQSSGIQFLSSSNTTIPRENLTRLSDKQDWSKTSLLSSTSASLPIRTLSTNTPSTKLDPITNEQSTSITFQTEILSTTVNDQVYITTSLEKRKTTTDSLTSTFLSTKIQDHETNSFTKLSSTPKISTKSSRKLIQANYKKLVEDDIIDDLLFS